MPPYEVETMTSWADRVELEEQTEGDLPPPSEHFDERKGVKTVTEYKFNEDGQKVKVIRTFKIEKRKVAKTIATRKSSWKKFGASKNDKPGPDPATTIPSEEIYMQFVSAKDGEGGAAAAAAQDDDPMNKLKGQKIVQCRVCKGDHWTTKCPYKDKLAPIEEKLTEAELESAGKGGHAYRFIGAQICSGAGWRWRSRQIRAAFSSRQGERRKRGSRRRWRRRIYA